MLRKNLLYGAHLQMTEHLELGLFGYTLLLISTGMTRHCSFLLEEQDSNPNEREYVKVMGYFNVSREAQG